MTDWNRYRDIEALRESGHAAEALGQLQKLRASATEPADVSSILLAKALCYRDLGQLDKAAEAASEAIDLLPQDGESRPYAEFSLGCIHEAEGKFELAAHEFKDLLKNHTKTLITEENVQLRRDVQLRLIANLIMMGLAIEPMAIAQGLKAESISASERAEVLYREAQAHGLLGSHERSLLLYREASSGPLDQSMAARAHFHIGELLYNRGEFQQALDEFKIAEEMAEVGGADENLFKDWINHTTKAVQNVHR